MKMRKRFDQPDEILTSINPADVENKRCGNPIFGKNDFPAIFGIHQLKLISRILLDYRDLVRIHSVPADDVHLGELRNGDDVVGTTSRSGNQSTEVEILRARVKLRMAFEENVVDRVNCPAVTPRWKDVLS